MISILVAGGVGLLIAVFSIPYLVDRSIARGIGQHVREDGPKEHLVKTGTPTMGGIGIIVAVVLGYLASHLKLGVDFSTGGVGIMAVMVLFGVIGFADDILKIRNRRSLGLSKVGKFTCQVAVGLAFAVLAHYWIKLPTTVSFVRQGGFHIQLGTPLWLLFVTFVIVASSNAVNLADGLDGLAAGSSTFSFGCLALIGYWQFRHLSTYHVLHGLDYATVAVAMVGALAGFLWWNAPPAKIFMGDTGSLSLGAVLGALCIVMQLDLLLLIIAGLFVLETLSVIAQVFSFQVFHRRVLRMAPLHHHFELLGWPETTILIRFWILAGLFTALGLGIFYADFLSLGPVGK
ncbi:MAG: phospho-N-acetylmuramoyl-pentapeptide-transferase [Acidimicrobiales bacterium]